MPGINRIAKPRSQAPDWTGTGEPHPRYLVAESSAASGPCLVVPWKVEFMRVEGGWLARGISGQRAEGVPGFS